LVHYLPQTFAEPVPPSSLYCFANASALAYSLVQAPFMGNSVEVSPLATAEKSRLSSGLLNFQGWILLVLIGWLYHSVLYRLVVQWIQDDNFTYCFVVPVFSLFVLWQERQKLKNIESAPSWTGNLLIGLAMLMLTLGEWGVERFTSQLSFLFLLAGLVIVFRGWPLFRAILFPWAFLILMVPLPNLILQRITFPMQMLASKVSTFMLETVHVPVLREGNIIKLAARPLYVAKACSGINSLLSLLTLSIIYGYLMEDRRWVRTVLACAAVPIALADNSFRIFVTALLVQYWNPDKAEGAFHEVQGLLTFIGSLALLFGLHSLINMVWKKTPENELKAMQTREGATRPRGHGPVSASSLRFLIPALLMLATAVGLEAHSQNEVSPPRQLLAALPAMIGGWNSTEVPLDDQTLEVLGHGDFLDRDYENASVAQSEVDLLIAYYPSQKLGDSPHSPEHCLTGAGWIPIQREVVELKSPDGTSFPANRQVVSQGGDRLIVLYWYQAHGRTVTSEYRLKYHLISDSIRMHRSDGALIRLMSPMYKGESAEAAQDRVMQFGNHLLPLLDNYIPR